MYTHSILIFCKTLIIATNSHQKEQGVHILKAVDPLLTLGSLATNVEHAVLQRAEIKMSLGDAGGP